MHVYALFMPCWSLLPNRTLNIHEHTICNSRHPDAALCARQEHLSKKCSVCVTTSLLQLRRCLVLIFVFQRCLFSIVPYCSHFSFRQMWKPWLALQVQCWCGHSGRYPKRCHRRAPGATFNRKLMVSPSWELGDLHRFTIFAHMIWRSILEGKPGNHPDGWVGVERDQKRSVRLWWCQCHAEFPAQTFRCKLKDKNDMELPSESEEEELGQAEATNSVARIWLQKLRINSDGNRVRSVTYRPATRHISSWQVPNGTSEPGTVLKGRDTQRYSEYSYYCDCCRLALVYMHLKRHLCRHTYAHFVDTFVDRPIHLVQKTTCVSLDRKPQAFFNGHIWDM